MGQREAQAWIWRGTKPLAFLVKQVWRGLWGPWCPLESALYLPVTGSVSPRGHQSLGPADRVVQLPVCRMGSPVSDMMGEVEAVRSSVAPWPSHGSISICH